MKFNVYLIYSIAIILNSLILTNSAYLFGSDLQFNIPEKFKADFLSEADFEHFLKNLIQKLKLRIVEKLFQSFKLRNTIKQKNLNKNLTSNTKTFTAFDKINHISINFDDYVRRIKASSDKSFEKMILPINNINNTYGHWKGIVSANFNESKKINYLKNEKEAHIIKNQIRNEHYTNITIKKIENESNCEILKYQTKLNENISVIYPNASIYDNVSVFDDKKGPRANKKYKESLNNENNSLNYYNSNPRREQEENNRDEKMLNKKDVSLTKIFRDNSKTALIINKSIDIDTFNEIDKNYSYNYFYENLFFFNSNKSFIDFSNVFFKSDKNFQMKIFGKKLIDYFSSDNLDINDNFLDSFYKYYLNMKIDKKAIEDLRYSKLKQEMDFFALLEREKNSVSSKRNLKNLRKIGSNNTLSNSEYNGSSISNQTQNNSKKVNSKFNLSFTNDSLINEIKSSLNRKSNSDEKKNKPSLSFSSPSIIKRSIKIFIDIQNECDVLFEDKIYYEGDNFTNYFVDHIIMNRKSNFIEPRDVKADKASIKYFVFNRKLNMFTLDIDKDPYQNFSINYDYLVSGMISALSNDAFINSKPDKNSNLFTWKVYNENSQNKNVNLEVEVHFGLGPDYDYNEIKFNHHFVKKDKIFQNKNLTYFSWNGDLLPYEIMTINSFFPIIFKSCEMEKLSISLVILGSLFVILIIISVYLMIVNIIKDFY